MEFPNLENIHKLFQEKKMFYGLNKIELKEIMKLKI
jgi:hypothetical protein